MGKVGLRPDRTKAKRFKHIAYDLEWRWIESGLDHLGRKNRSLYVVWVGVWDERGYRGYPTVKAFLRAELVPKNTGRRFYAHFGGASDMIFVLRELAKLDHRTHRVEGVFSSSSAIFLKVYTPRFEWLFLDSYWTIRAPLREIGDWIDAPKGDCDVQNSSMPEIITYNERDCLILYQAIERFQGAILEQGGELGVTAASTALTTFKKRFLKRAIRNSPRCDKFAMPSYQASRVEKIRDRCDWAFDYDINSSFPYAMTFPVAGSPTGMHTRLPDREETLWIADCDVVVPEQYLPPLPFRTEDHRVFFPTGSFRTSITSEDMKCGGFQIMKVHNCQTYESRLEWKGFAETFYGLRKLSGLEGKAYKIIANSLYGKTAEGEDKDMLVLRPSAKQRDRCLMIEAGIYIEPVKKKIPHRHVAASSIITSRARRFLYEHGRSVLDRGGKLYYWDTDALITDVKMFESADLGGLKLEARIEDGEFITQKSYALLAQVVKPGFIGPIQRQHIVRAKGFSKVIGTRGDSQRLDYEAFVRIRDGYAVEVERMLRIKELARRNEGKADWIPTSITTAKQLRTESIRPKRKRDGKNDSIPWSIEEILKQQ